MTHPYSSLSTSDSEEKPPLPHYSRPRPSWDVVVDRLRPLVIQWHRWLLLIPLSLVLLVSIWEHGRTHSRSGAGFVNVQVPQLSRVPWSKDERELRAYRWGFHAPHASLLKVISELSTDERAVRDWLLRSRVLSGAGVGIGLGRTNRSENTQRVQSAPLQVRSDGVAALRALGVPTGSSQQKLLDLEEESEWGGQASVCKASNGKWRAASSAYSDLHAEMMNGTRDAWLVESACSAWGDCGGLADRLLGITSAFLYSILTSRALTLPWASEPLDLLFDSAGIDWSQPYRAANPPPHPVYDSRVMTNSVENFAARNKNAPDLVPLWEGALKSWRVRGVGAVRWIKMDRANRGTVLASRESTLVRPLLDDLGLTASSSYACLMDYLFRPKADTLRFVTEYTSLFALPTVYSIGLQIRLGDYEMGHPEFSVSIDHHRHFFDCASQVASARAHPSQRIVYYLVSDSRSLKEAAVAAYPELVVVSGLEPHHVEVDHNGTRVALDGQHIAVAEMWTLRDVDFHILSFASSFGKIPTWMHGGDGAIVLPGGRWDSEPTIDCSPAQIKNLTELAADWASG